MRLPRYVTLGYEGRHWIAYYYLINWQTWALGISFDWHAPNIELHIGPGFFRIGRRSSGPAHWWPGWCVYSRE